MHTRDAFLIALLALLYTAVASIKPIHIDEAANVYYARHIAAHPLDPYGFEMYWYQSPMPANHVLTPPVLVYWWAVAVKLFGEQPVLWKLWLLPFTLAFAFSLHALFRRFARGLETPLTWMTVLSPAMLPSLNLMPDIPALAWSLLAVVVFLRACDRGAWGLAALAGLLAGVGMQTKYTAFVTPAVLLLRAAFVGRWRLGLLTGVVAGMVFVSWEVLIAWKYGESHFWYQVRSSGGGLLDKSFLLLPLLPTVGGVAPIVGLLGMTALGVRRGLILLGGAIVVLGLALLAWFDDGALGRSEFILPWLIFGAFGLVVCGAGCGLARAAWKSGTDGRFLVLWLGLELAGYFALTPFPAVRRVLALVIVLTLLAGRVLCLSARKSSRLNGGVVRPIIMGNILLGLLFFFVDVYDARAQKLGARQAARDVGEGRVWYVGHWGFQYYAEQAGITPVVPDESTLRPGDWLVLPGDPIVRQEIVVSEEDSAFAFQVRIEDRLPWRTVMGYYGGAEPLSHRAGPRLTVEVRRVTRPWTPASAP